MMTADEILDYIRERVNGIANDMEDWGFDEGDMDEWTQGNYEAYTHLLAKITGTKE